MAPRGSSADPKVTALRESRCLNPHPEQVTDEVFLSEEFFDARDAVQVKYEMVRRVQVDGESVTAAAAAFGYSRPSYYQAAAALAESGLDGLVPAKPGPRGGHKLTSEILTWAEQVDCQSGVDAELGVLGHLRALVPGQRPAQLLGPGGDRGSRTQTGRRSCSRSRTPRDHLAYEAFGCAPRLA